MSFIDVETRLDLFLGREAETNGERIVRLFLDDDSELANPIYTLDELGKLDSTVFLATKWDKMLVEKKISENLPDITTILRKGTFCTRFETFEGFWVDIVA